MSKEVFTSFKLIGYKINEIGNGYFIVQRPDKTESLFDGDGNLIIHKAKEICKITDKIYSLYEIDSKGNILKTKSIANSKGKILDNGNIVCGFDNRTISVYNNKKNNVYTDDGVLVYEGLSQYKVTRTIRYDNEYWMLATKAIYLTSSTKHDLISSHCRIKPICGLSNISINNHYIQGVESKDIPNNLSYKKIIKKHSGEEIHTKGISMIDTIDIDNDTLIAISNDTITVIQNGEEININNSRIINGVIKSYSVNEVYFTSNREIIGIEDCNGMYFLNIRTKAKSEYFSDLQPQGLVGIRVVNNIIYVVKLNLETMTMVDTLINENENMKYVTDKDKIVFKSQDAHDTKYYSYDFKELLHEF